MSSLSATTRLPLAHFHRAGELSPALRAKMEQLINALASLGDHYPSVTALTCDRAIEAIRQLSKDTP